LANKAKHSLKIIPAIFLDLCKGGHAKDPQKEMQHLDCFQSQGPIGAEMKKNKMLTRIYGTAFSDKKELDEHLEMLEEAKKRDHKKLGRELELFFFDETAPGMTYWLPKDLLFIKLSITILAKCIKNMAIKKS